MSSWAKSDAFGSAPLWALARVKKALSQEIWERLFQQLFNNATANNLISGVTIGLFNVAGGERFSGCHQVGF